MNADLLPEYETSLSETLHCRCTVCGGWWTMNDGLNRLPLAVPYWCPHCGQRLTPAQYPADPPAPRPHQPPQELELMNARHTAALNFQAPEFQAPKYGYPTPDRLIGKNVCCKCQREVTTHAFIAKDGYRIETHHCPTHGDVAPMRSIIHNSQRTPP